MKTMGRAYPSIDALVRDREVLTVEQAAQYLQVHKITLYKYIRTGRLPAAKLGKVYRILRRDLEAFVAPSRRGR
ncbi:MAG: helix-turn-helix domain-containing protein [Armatimonadota bacterium]|nr:helix-turn-helix domain-containing protein [Armatimonadota bacterium]MDR7452188.1 helix-turn-helix domain-containing protein [Armatimonadota bacterium]MDR7468045.1 helix-turn-helix domain-containing protein [Armatimonadota bacterium]MDR7494914.1 helix-turn-helix domain-containing protein [Armatimonadota bacterium]MDR7500364.1 helix-turn-helix domain-containing protein [Armatimonadota bacterium]